MASQKESHMRTIVRSVGVVLLLCAAAGCPNRGKGPDLSALEDGKPPKDTLPPPRELPSEAQDVFFCFWNVENLYDDVDDGRTKRGDAEYDAYFAEKTEARETKYAHIAQVLAGM